MKKIKNIIQQMSRLVYLLLMSTTFFPSCESLLDEAPKAMVVETFFNTAEEVQTAVNAIYSPLRASDGMAVYEATPRL